MVSNKGNLYNGKLHRSTTLRIIDSLATHLKMILQKSILRYLYKIFGLNILATQHIVIQGRWNVFTTGPAKLDHEDYAIKCVGGRQLHEY